MKDREKGLNVGILGGTFDPIHLGHLSMAQAALKALSLDKVLLIPSGHPAYKMEKQEVTDKAQRMEMVRLALLNLPGLEASDLEIRRPGNTYTSDTLRELKNLEPNSSFYLILGADALGTVPKWHEKETVLQLSTLVVFDRPEIEEEKLEELIRDLADRQDAKILRIRQEIPDISSSKIRKRLQLGEKLAGLVPEKVEQYIREQGLYGIGHLK